MPQQINLITETKRGTLVKSPAVIEIEGGRIWFLKSPYSLKDEIKAMQGAKWHGYEDQPRKIWSVSDCPRNRFQLAYLSGNDPYAWFDRPVYEHEYERPLRLHQKEMTDHALTYHFCIWAAEMGCIDGDATVHVKRALRPVVSISLRELYQRFKGEKGRQWKSSLPTRILGLQDGRFGYNTVVDVLDKGIQGVVIVVFKSGNTLRCTPDHEICSANGRFVRADRLVSGSPVMATGPMIDTVESVTPCGKTHVYDVVCEDPYRNFVANGVVVHNCGKTLSAIEVIEKSNVQPWYWVGPLRANEAIKLEFVKWKIDPNVTVEMMTYDKLVSLMDNWPGGDVPRGVIFDESTTLKNYTSQRSKAARMLADMIRSQYGYDGYAILMSGTPSPKTPCDWFSQCEVAFPGFLKEGSETAMEQRLAFLTQKEFNSGIVNKRIGWRDDERKCAECGLLYDDGHHEEEFHDDHHKYKPSINEVALLAERLKGLVLVKHLRDCLDLPDKQYRTIKCKPNSSTLRVAKVIAESSPNAMQCLTMLRELSDGFLYRETQDGEKKCTHCGGTKEVWEWYDPSDPDRKYTAIDMLKPEVVAGLVQTIVLCPNCGGTGIVPNMVRTAQEIPTPKEPALIDLLEECEDHGRIVIFAGFTGSVDRCVNICLRNRWDVVRCDGRGFNVYQMQSDNEMKKVTLTKPLDYWSDSENRRVAFVAHPESGGLGLTLTEANMAVFWSNSWKPQYRIQSEARIHRDGMDLNRGATIVDLIHLPSDERVLEVIRDNRRIELMTMGEISELYSGVEAS